MKALKLVAAAIAASVALTAASPPAEAHRRVRGGVTLQFGWPGYWGPGYWGPGYWGGVRHYAYPPPVYYYPRVYGPPAVVSPPSEPVYIERDAPEESAPPAATVWWYWCPGAKGYYPYVQQCPGGWQRVPPQPVPAK